MTFPVEESLAAAGANDLRIFFVNRLGVFPQNHLVLEALPACLAQVRLVNGRMVDLEGENEFVSICVLLPFFNLCLNVRRTSTYLKLHSLKWPKARNIKVPSSIVHILFTRMPL